MSDDAYRPPYVLTDRTVALVEQIGEALGRVAEAGRSFRLRRANRIRSIHGSVAIEGNTLSEEQVSAILEGKRVVAAPREILEVENALTVYDRLKDWNPLAEADLLSAHALLMAGLLRDCGAYRKKNAGVSGAEGVIHVAPPPDRVPWLMKQLFQWLASSDQHPLVKSCVFHYEFEFIHPFADGNGRMGRLWQTLLLSRWNPVFSELAVESMVHEHQQDYYDAINRSSAASQSGPFIEFMLQMILDSLRTDQVSDQVSDQVERLLKILQEGPLTASGLMEGLGLSHRPTLRKNYLHPALEAGCIEMTQPDSPNSPTQKYRLTAKGRNMVEK